MAQPIIDALSRAGTPTVIASCYELHELEDLKISGVLVSKPYSEGDLAEALGKVLETSPG